MRNYNLDWIRVFAMIGVVADHYTGLFGCDWLRNCGLQVGGGNVTIFFVISALLFGTKWAKDEHNAFEPVSFLKKRVLRIYIPMWILILTVIPMEWWLVGRFEPTTIVANAIGLGWAKPFGISGHLWYITMMMILYLCFVFLSRIRLDRIKWYWWAVAFLAIILGYYVLQERLTTFSKAAPLLFMFFGSLMFAKGNTIIEYVKKYKIVVVVLAVLLLSLSLYVFILGWHDTHKAWATASAIISGFLEFLALYVCLNIRKENKAIKCLSGISYEIYLVHLPIIPLAGLMFDNPWIVLFVGNVLSIILAIVLNKISSRILNEF